MLLISSWLWRKGVYPNSRLLLLVRAGQWEGVDGHDLAGSLQHTYGTTSAGRYKLQTMHSYHCVTLRFSARRYGYEQVRQWRKPLPLPEQPPNCPQAEWRNSTHDAACVKAIAKAKGNKLREDCDEGLSAELLEFFERTLAYSEQQRWDTQQVMRCKLVARGRKLLQRLNDPAKRGPLLENYLRRMGRLNPSLEVTV